METLGPDPGPQQKKGNLTLRPGATVEEVDAALGYERNQSPASNPPEEEELLYKIIQGSLQRTELQPEETPLSR